MICYHHDSPVCAPCSPPLRRFFFLTIRPPPRSTLFPYTTLFRSAETAAASGSSSRTWNHSCPGRASSPDRSGRSEEHTSELQSLTNLVCRLLLEKKKKNIT